MRRQQAFDGAKIMHPKVDGDAQSEKKIYISGSAERKKHVQIRKCASD